MKAVHVALAAFGGALVGATAALLLAPEKVQTLAVTSRNSSKKNAPLLKTAMSTP